MKISQEPLGIFENRKNWDNPHTQDYLLSPIYKLPLKNGMLKVKNIIFIQSSVLSKFEYYEEFTLALHTLIKDFRFNINKRK